MKKRELSLFLGTHKKHRWILTRLTTTVHLFASTSRNGGGAIISHGIRELSWSPSPLVSIFLRRVDSSYFSGELGRKRLVNIILLDFSFLVCFVHFLLADSIRGARECDRHLPTSRMVSYPICPARKPDGHQIRLFLITLALVLSNSRASLIRNMSFYHN